jgi:N-acetylneuraminic acid mutarotase
MLAAACADVFAQVPPGAWWSAASLPRARAEHSVVALEGMLYVVGGGVEDASGKDKQGGGASALVEVYDPARDQWSRRSQMPRALTHVGLAALDGKLYVAGGFVADIHRDAQPDAFVYDPRTDRWQALPPLPKPRASVGLVALNGRIHAIGGRAPNDALQADHDVFDPATGRWTSAAPLPVARDHLVAVVAKGRIHVIGGRTGDYTDVTAHHDVYDPATDAWQPAPPMPTPRSAMAAALHRDTIVVYGGECRGGNTYFENEGYDLGSRRWRALQPMEGRHGFGAATVANRIYFVAGARGCGGEGLSKELLVFELP